MESLNTLNTSKGIPRPGELIYPNIVIGRRGLEKLDLLLLVIEALDINGSQALLMVSSNMNLHEHFPNQVELWKFRSHNPLRKVNRRGNLKPKESDALIILVCYMAERLYPLIRQLLSIKEPNAINDAKWVILNDRLSDLLKERMNTKRGSINTLIDPNSSKSLLRHLILTLSFCAGLGGLNRLKVSLMDNINSSLNYV
tara:strand:+ start:1921 stop:2517 length:597 start_codon:yes stop_codon:yes gene_type:complete